MRLLEYHATQPAPEHTRQKARKMKLADMLHCKMHPAAQPVNTFPWGVHPTGARRPKVGRSGMHDGINVLCALRERQAHLRHRFHKLERTIMSAISDFATAMNAFNDQDDAAVASIQTEVAALQAEIVTLQNSPGTITPADQASLDALQARAKTINDKLAALAATTPPAVPAAVAKPPL